MMEIAALTYGLIVLAVIGFQFCLIAGAPWGALTQGGRHQGPLPTSGRITAGVSVLLLAAMAAAIVSAAGFWPGWPAWTGWTALSVQALSTLLNWITPSRPERRLWGPVTLVMLGLAVLLVLA